MRIYVSLGLDALFICLNVLIINWTITTDKKIKVQFRKASLYAFLDSSPIKPIHQTVRKIHIIEVTY